MRAVPLVARALEICAHAELELPAILLTDALDVLTDPDMPEETPPTGTDAPCLPSAGRCACPPRGAGW